MHPWFFLFVKLMTKQKILLFFVILLSILVCIGLVQNSHAEQVEPVRENIKNPRSANFQQKIEKYFAAGDRLLMPLGFYSVGQGHHKNDEMKRSVHRGITFIQRYAVKKYDSQATLENAHKDISNAKEAGVGLALTLPTQFLDRDSEWWMSYLQTLEPERQVLIWYLPEEPNIAVLPRLKRLAEVVREVDKSERIITTYLKGSNQYIMKESATFLDCIVYGSYPTQSPELSRLRVGHRIDFAYDQGAPAVMAALEAFETKGGWTNPEHVEFDAYLALIHGAKGIWWYCYNKARQKPELLEAVLAVAEVLNGPEYVGEVFLRGKNCENIRCRIASGPKVFSDGFTSSMKFKMLNNPSVHWRAFNHRGNVYLFMVNCCQIFKKSYSQADEDAFTLELEFTGFDTDSKITRLDGKSTYSYRSGLLSVALKPLSVAVFKVSR